MCAKVTTEVNAFSHGKKNMANVNTLFLGRDKFYFVQKNPLDSTKKFSETGIIKMHKCSFTTYLLCLVDVYFQQTVCIPMGFKCASLIVDFFLYLYEADFIQGNHVSGVMVTRLAS